MKKWIVYSEIIGGLACKFIFSSTEKKTIIEEHSLLYMYTWLKKISNS